MIKSLALAGAAALTLLAAPAVAKTYVIPIGLPQADGVWDVSGTFNTSPAAKETLSFYEILNGKNSLLAQTIYTGVTGTLDVLNLAEGSYFYKLSGAATLDSFTVSAVDPAATPEASTWAMLGLGFAGVGFLGFSRRKESRYAL